MSKIAIYEEIEGRLDEINNKISPANIDDWYNDLKNVTDMFTKKERLKDYIISLEYVKKEIDQKDDDSREDDIRRINQILYTLKSHEPDMLLDNLKRKGYAIARSDEELRKTIAKEALRMLEQARLGKRDVVVGMLMRIFLVNSRQFPQDLINALKNEYDISQFRAFVYAFLSGFITE